MAGEEGGDSDQHPGDDSEDRVLTGRPPVGDELRLEGRLIVGKHGPDIDKFLGGLRVLGSGVDDCSAERATRLEPWVSRPRSSVCRGAHGVPGGIADEGVALPGRGGVERSHKEAVTNALRKCRGKGGGQCGDVELLRHRDVAQGVRGGDETRSRGVGKIGDVRNGADGNGARLGSDSSGNLGCDTAGSTLGDTSDGHARMDDRPLPPPIEGKASVA